jgi:hypothetical protein
MKDRTWLKRLFTLENIIAVIGIIIAAFLAVLGIWQRSQELTLNAIIALLTALALNQTIIQYKNVTEYESASRMEASLSDLFELQTEISKQIRDLPFANIRLAPRRGNFKGSLSDTFQDVLGDFPKKPHSVCISGLTLLGALAMDPGFFNDIAENQESSLRFLIVKPGSAAVCSAAGFQEDMKAREDRIRTAIGLLKDIRGKRDNVEIKLTPISPPFSLVIIDPDKPSGVTQVELYGRGIDTRDRPHFLLTKKMHPYWHKFFNDQFTALWNEKEAQTLEAFEGSKENEVAREGERKGEATAK